MNHAALVALIVSLSGADPVDPEALASAVEANSKSRDWAALLLTIVAHEASFSDRIRRNDFKPWEADPIKRKGVVFHQAWGMFQEHDNLNNHADWGSTDLAVQVASGSRALKGAYWSCARFYPKNSPPPVWVAFTINAYAGKACDAKWSGLDARMATFNRIRARI